MALFEKKTIIKNEIDYDKLAKAIINAQKDTNNEQMERSITRAILSYKEAEKIKSEEVEKERTINWKKTIGLIDIPSDAGFFTKKIISLKNNLKTLKLFIFYKKEYAEEMRMAFAFFAMISSMVFSLMKWLFILISVVVVYLVSIHKLTIISLFMVILTLFFAKLMHIIGVEIEQLRDNEKINMIFSSLMAFIAALFTVLAFVRR